MTTSWKAKKSLFGLLLFAANVTVNAISLFGCERCGLFQRMLYKENDDSTECEDEGCLPMWYQFTRGYSCGTCSDEGGPNGGTVGGGTEIGDSGTGQMTMWGDGDPGPVIGGSCEYAQSASTQQGSDWLVPYVNELNYCAVNDALYQSGLGCGKCYRITFDGQGGTDPGRAGSADIQVVDSGSAKEFDCHLHAHSEITGANTGVFPITYQEITCTSTGTYIVVLDGNNAWYTKILVAGGPTSVQSVNLTVGTDKKYALSQLSGATWSTSMDGTESLPVRFEINYSNNFIETLDCFGSTWPVNTGSQCSK